MARTGNTPPEANSKGGINLSIPPEQRTGEPLSEIGSGPDIGERGEYRPARYPCRSGIREDR